MVVIGYGEQEIMSADVYTDAELTRRVPAGHCQSCGIKLPPHGDPLVCEAHRPDTCARCDRDITHDR